MFKNLIKKKIFANIVLELILIKLGRFHSAFSRLYPSNTHYSKNTMRKVKRGNLFFELDISDYQDYLVYFNLDADSSKPLLKFLPKQEGLILDIGANIGQTALWIADYLNTASIKIIAFEPVPVTYNKLCRNINLNSFTNITLENIALGKEDGELMMVMPSPFNSGAFRALTEANKNEAKFKVKQTTLDNYLTSNNKNVTFIKIDVEGFEYNALLGAEETIKKYLPILFIELSDSNLRSQGYSAKELVQLIRSYGYSKIVDANTLIDIEEDTFTNSHIDILCKAQ